MRKSKIPELSKPETLSHHVRHAHNSPLLTEEEEQDFAKRWHEHEDQAALDQLIQSHMRLVKSIANGYRGYGLPVDDLISEGHIGIMQAVKRFDPEKGYRFSTYARWWIKAAIQEYVMRSWSMVKIGTTSAQKKLFFTLRKLKNKLSQEKQDSLNLEDLEAISQRTGVPLEEILNMESRLEQRDKSLNAQISFSGDKEGEWQDLLEDHGENHELTFLHRDELEKRQSFLENSLQCLNEREWMVLNERRLQEPPKTLDEIAQLLGLSKQRVSQIEIAAFEKLQKETKKQVNAYHKDRTSLYPHSKLPLLFLPTILRAALSHGLS
jgi:RNA polymerase sigma-32 factor